MFSIFCVSFASGPDKMQSDPQNKKRSRSRSVRANEVPLNMLGKKDDPVPSPQFKRGSFFPVFDPGGAWRDSAAGRRRRWQECPCRPAIIVYRFAISRSLHFKSHCPSRITRFLGDAQSRTAKSEMATRSGIPTAA